MVLVIQCVACLDIVVHGDVVVMSIYSGTICLVSFMLAGCREDVREMNMGHDIDSI